MNQPRTWLFISLMGLVGDFSLPALAQNGLDAHGGLERIHGHPGQTFHLEKLGSRWWLVTPEGHGMFIRAVSKVDTADYGGSGGFTAYDGVFLQRVAGALSANLCAAAENSLARDVVDPGTGTTLKDRGDVLYLGSSQFRPNNTYFWLDQLGQGGQVQWSYSTAQGWKPLQPGGKPHGGAALGPDGSWNLDVGNYMAPDEHGFGKWGSRQANKITWWTMASGFPGDFTPVPLPGDSTPRYYLRGVVTRAFTVPPVLNQLYERPDLDEVMARKYGPGNHRRRWAEAVTRRLLSWGFNACGQYSGQYVVQAPALARRLPVEPTWALGGWATRKDSPHRVKNVYAGAVFPPGSNNLVYQGLQPDVFEPGFAEAYHKLVARQASARDPWSWALIPEEADYLFGINSLTHDHMGYVVLSQNPHQSRTHRDGEEVRYSDSRLYARYALRDMLRDRYRAEGDPLPVFPAGAVVPAFSYARRPEGRELAALEKLNAAWGTHYTTWDTSAGDLLKGDNAWGTGTGFMDENGKGVLAPGVRSIGFDRPFTPAGRPAIRKDLDDFLALFAAHYGTVLKRVFSKVPHPVLLLPLYNGPDCVYRAIAPHVDGFWISVPSAGEALRIYNAGHKPVVVADYLTADPDSPWYFRARIASLRHDAASGTTTVTAPELRYVYRLAQFVTFPDCRELMEKGTCGGKYVYAYPRVKAAHWNTLVVPGDFTRGVKPGMHVEMWKHGKYPYDCPTQEKRAAKMIRHYESLLKLRGDDGVQFVIGIEHWCLYDPAVSNWCDNANFGLATFQDNAYDGVEARRRGGVDANGRPTGGEDVDHGDLLTSLGRFLRALDERKD